MDRQIVYVGQIPQDTDLLLTNKNTMIGLGYLMQAVLGTSTLVDGLACTPTSPASMSVQVGPGSIYSQTSVDATAYGSIAADTTDQIVKQGIIMSTQTFSCPAPGTAGQSVVYLIEAQYQDVDTGSTVLPYYNASNPAVAYSGPNNTGVSQATIRQGLCKVQVKAGTPATTGSQTTPSPDSGFTGLYAVTVANGASTITSGNIVQLTSAPFISPKLPAIIAAVQAGAANFVTDTSGTANTITIALTPAVGSLTTGMRVWVKVANTNTSAVVINTNGLGNVSATRKDGSAIPQGAIQANGLYAFVYDGSHWQLEGPSVRFSLTANTTFYVATTGNDSTNTGLSSGSPWATIQKAINFISTSIDLAGFTATIQCADGTYTAGGSVGVPFTGGGTVVLQGDTATPANCIISTTSANCITVSNGAQLSIAGFKLQTTTSGLGILVQTAAFVQIIGNMNYGTIASGGYHLYAGSDGLIVISSNYTVSGSAPTHYGANAGTINIGSAITVTLSGTPAFATAFALATNLGNLQLAGITFSGSATGVRYSAVANSLIQTSGGGASYLPGNSAGSTATGGQYV